MFSNKTPNLHYVTLTGTFPRYAKLCLTLTGSFQRYPNPNGFVMQMLGLVRISKQQKGSVKSKPIWAYLSNFTFDTDLSRYESLIHKNNISGGLSY